MDGPSNTSSKEHFGVAKDPGSGAGSVDEVNHNLESGAVQQPEKAGGLSKKVKILIGAVIFVLVALALILGLVLTVGKKKPSTGGTSSSSNSGGDASPTPTSTAGTGTTPQNAVVSGTTGSTITMDDGTTFTYTNTFGGEWLADPKKPLGSGGKAQSWTPRIGEEWKWGQDKINGVNLGGWLVTEPFIVPALYEKYLQNDLGIHVTDEWTLSQAMGSKLAEEMENHYKTFITEKDFADIAAAGLNWLRIPIGYWAIETMNDEPFLQGVSWTYFLKALGWARKYGLRIYLDFHGLPGSQNGWNHSGKGGDINFMKGVMGVANAQRTLTYLRIFTEFISQPQYKDIVLMFGIVNEIRWETGAEQIESFYGEAYETIRKSTGLGAGNGPYIAIHEGFQGTARWEGFLAGADRLILDQHPYLAFRGDTAGATPAGSAPDTCSWGTSMNRSQRVFGVTIAGEFSTAINNCGLWLNGIGNEDPASCDVWNDWASWDAATIAGLKEVSMASMDALQNYFYWTWKIGDSTVLKTSSCPMWHYKLGMEKGWIPKDPREVSGTCSKLSGDFTPFDGQFPATATGGAGAGQLQATPVFPPATLNDGLAADTLPTYTATGALKTLAVPTFTAAPDVDAGTGWNNANDNELAYVPVAGCTYPNAYDANNVAVPAACTGA